MQPTTSSLHHESVPISYAAIVMSTEVPALTEFKIEGLGPNPKSQTLTPMINEHLQEITNLPDDHACPREENELFLWASKHMRRKEKSKKRNEGKGTPKEISVHAQYHS